MALPLSRAQQPMDHVFLRGHLPPKSRRPLPSTKRIPQPFLPPQAAAVRDGFFEAQLLGIYELPERPVVDLQPAFGKLGDPRIMISCVAGISNPPSVRAAGVLRLPRRRLAACGRNWRECKNWYSTLRTVSDHRAHRDRTNDSSVRAFAVKTRAFGAPLRGFGS